MREGLQVTATNPRQGKLPDGRGCEVPVGGFPSGDCTGLELSDKSAGSAAHLWSDVHGSTEEGDPDGAGENPPREEEGWGKEAGLLAFISRGMERDQKTGTDARLVCATQANGMIVNGPRASKNANVGESFPL